MTDKTLAITDNLTMTSKEIAELTGKQHRNVVRDLKVLDEQGVIDLLKFEHISKDSMNRDQTVYRLPSDRYYCTRLLGFRLLEDQYVQELIDAGMDWDYVATCFDEQFPPSEEPDPETALVVSAVIAMLERVKAEMRPPDAEVLSYVFVKTPHDGNVMMTFYTGTRH